MYLASKEALARAGIKPVEARVIAQGFQAHTLVPNGHFLADPGRSQAAAERMVSRGFLTKVDTLQPAGWGVFLLTQECWDRVREVLKEPKS